jgi:hypothetical protein
MSARIARRAENVSLTLRNWLIGCYIASYGPAGYRYLGSCLRRAFPGTEGFSSRNLKYMRAFA